METQAQTVLTLGMDQITKFVYRLDFSILCLGDSVPLDEQEDVQTF